MNFIFKAIPYPIKRLLRPYLCRYRLNHEQRFNWVLKLLNSDDFFFVQIGANDGVSFDPIHKHIVENKWKGVLVEPLPDLMERLKENYADMDGLFFEMSAITDDPLLSSITRIKPDAIARGELPDWAQGVSSLTPHKNVISKANGGAAIDDNLFEVIKKYTITENIKTISFSDLLEKYKIEKIDLLQIDAEGYDFEIIRSIDLSICAPKIIHAEFYNLYKTEKDALLKLLAKNGYFIMYAQKDILAVQKKTLWGVQ